MLVRIISPEELYSTVKNLVVKRVSLLMNILPGRRPWSEPGPGISIGGSAKLGGRSFSNMIMSVRESMLESSWLVLMKKRAR